jgi:hypothetical protein
MQIHSLHSPADLLRGNIKTLKHSQKEAQVMAHANA